MSKEIVDKGCYVTTRDNLVRIHFHINGNYRYRTINGSVSEAKKILTELKKLIDGKPSRNKEANKIYKACQRYDKKVNDSVIYEGVVKEYEKENDTLKLQLLDTNNYLEIVLAQLNNQNKASTVNGKLAECLSEEEFYHVMNSLADYYNLRYSDSKDISQRKIILDKILSENPVSGKEKELYDKLLLVLKGMSSKTIDTTISSFNRIGFEAVKLNGGHLKVYPYGKPELFSIIASTSGDVRSIRNAARNIVKKLLR